MSDGIKLREANPAAPTCVCERLSDSSTWLAARLRLWLQLQRHNVMGCEVGNLRRGVGRLMRTAKSTKLGTPRSVIARFCGQSALKLWVL